MNILSKKTFWHLIAITFMIEFAIKVSPGYIGPFIQKDLSLSYTQVGIYSAIFYIAYALLQLPAGILVYNYGIKRNFLALLLLFISGLSITSIGQSFTTLCLARMMMGVGSAITFTTLLTLALRWFDEKYFPYYVGITNLFAMLGSIFLALSFYLIDIENNWQYLFLFFTALLSIIILCLLFLPDSDEKNIKIEPSFHVIKKILIDKIFWTYLVIAITMVLPISIIPEMWGVLYLENRHHVEANLTPLLISLVFCGIAIGGPSIGLLSKRIHLNQLLKYGLILESLSLILFTLQGYSFLFLALFCLGFFASSMLLCFTLIKDRFKSVAPVAIGLFNTLLTIGTSLSQPSIGWILDRYPTSSPSYKLTICFYLLCLINLLLAFTAQLSSPKEQKR